jgi:hypothetical protein
MCLHREQMNTGIVLVINRKAERKLSCSSVDRRVVLLQLNADAKLMKQVIFIEYS